MPSRAGIGRRADLASENGGFHVLGQGMRKDVSISLEHLGHTLDLGYGVTDSIKTRSGGKHGDVASDFGGGGDGAESGYIELLVVVVRDDKGRCEARIAGK